MATDVGALVAELARQLAELNHNVRVMAERLDGDVPSRAEFEAVRSRVYGDLATKAALEELRREVQLDSQLRALGQAGLYPVGEGAVEECTPEELALDQWVEDAGLSAIAEAYADADIRTFDLITEFRSGGSKDPTIEEFDELCRKGQGELPGGTISGALGWETNRGPWPIRLVCSARWPMRSCEYHQDCDAALPWHVKSSYNQDGEDRIYRLLFCLRWPPSGHFAFVTSVSSPGAVVSKTLEGGAMTSVSSPGAVVSKTLEGGTVALETYASSDGFIVFKFVSQLSEGWGRFGRDLFAAGGSLSEAGAEMCVLEAKFSNEPY